MKTDCRCGHPADSTEPHPCHKPGCGKPAEHFFYAQPGLGKFALAGAQMKLSMSDSWGCPEHRAEFTAQLKAAEERLAKKQS